MSNFIHDLESLHDILYIEYNTPSNFINLTTLVKNYIGNDWVKYIKYYNNILLEINYFSYLITNFFLFVKYLSKEKYFTFNKENYSIEKKYLLFTFILFFLNKYQIL